MGSLSLKNALLYDADGAASIAGARRKALD